MGSVIQISRRPLVRRIERPSRSDADGGESIRSLYILIGGFLATALIMCAVVVAALSNTWMDVLVISGVVFVFALVKIIIANVLMYMMIRVDETTAAAPVPAKAGAVFVRKPTPSRRNPPGGGRRGTKPGAGRLAVMAHKPLPRAPR
jgi:hypothetical protein